MTHIYINDSYIDQLKKVPKKEEILNKKPRRKSSLEKSRSRKKGKNSSECNAEPDIIASHDISHILTSENCEFALKTFSQFKTPNSTKPTRKRKANPNPEANNTNNTPNKSNSNPNPNLNHTTVTSSNVGFNKFNFGENSTNGESSTTTTKCSNIPKSKKCC